MDRRSFAQKETRVRRLTDTQLLSDAKIGYATHKLFVDEHGSGTEEYWNSLGHNQICYYRELRRRGLGRFILTIKTEWRRQNT